MILLTLALATAADPAPAKAAEDRMICRKLERTGTRLSRNRPVCATAAEWKLLSDRARKDTDDIQRRGRPVEGPAF